MLKWFQVLFNRQTGLTGLQSRDTPRSQKVNGLVKEKFSPTRPLFGYKLDICAHIGTAACV